MEHVTEVDFDLPIIEPVYVNVDVPIYVPRFIEIACPVEGLDNECLQQIRDYANRMSLLSAQSALTLTEVERLAEALREVDPVKIANETEVLEKLVVSWQSELRTIEASHHLKPNIQRGYISSVIRQASAPVSRSSFHQALSHHETSVAELISGSHVTKLPRRSVSSTITSCYSSSHTLKHDRQTNTSTYKSAIPNTIPNEIVHLKQTTIAESYE